MGTQSKSTDPWKADETLLQVLRMQVREEVKRQLKSLKEPNANHREGASLDPLQY